MSILPALVLVFFQKVYDLFKAEHPEVKIKPSLFYSLRPRNVRLAREARRLLCCCTYHQNVEYLRKAIHRVMALNGSQQIIHFTDNTSLTNLIVCDERSIQCIFGQCEKCKGYPQLDVTMEAMKQFKCSKECTKKNIDCFDKKHTIRVLQYERITYQHKGKDKKKIELVDKQLQFDVIIETLRGKMKDFPRHRFNIDHTKQVWEQLEENLDEATLAKVQDFSENYTCVVLNEISSLHWTQTQATVYPVVCLRKVDGKIREDHIVIIR